MLSYYAHLTEQICVPGDKWDEGNRERKRKNIGKNGSREGRK
jgi:hypothetical protein